ncbi:MAG: hypothetical protein P1P69_04145 [Methanosarcinaceae archaeon]|nr:hypothetical protein [Methanosarcinaceae archaeon]
MQIPNTPTNNESSFNVDPIGFENRINYAALYHLYMQKLNDIHADGKLRDAISYFNSMVVTSFGGIFDAIFIKNCLDIIKKNDNYKTIYMLHRVEFGRLMTRSGIAPKPDIRIRYKGTWKVPEKFENLSMDGSKPEPEVEQ